MNATSAHEAQILQNYQDVQGMAGDAAQRAGRSPEEIRIVGVTKYVGVDATRALFLAGCRDLGESRPQSLWEKAEQLPPEIRWHLIGHLQRNKVRRSLPYLSLLHSLDSMRLAEQVAADASAQGLVVDALLEINLTDDASKTGLILPQAETWLQSYVANESLRGALRIVGLMGMSSLNAVPVQVRREFVALRSARDRWNVTYALAMNELSMGMSGDFEIAIEQGSTLIRIGSRLFEGVLDS